ncbi:hypothetical protein [Planctomicrobium sp. SH527]|uniref:hypothetical protein n=1 Tax=Planctomicrobium sp. SH527 TaxID=3448123 RepID=UPI003F5B724C
MRERQPGMTFCRMAEDAGPDVLDPPGGNPPPYMHTQEEEPFLNLKGEVFREVSPRYGIEIRVPKH